MDNEIEANQRRRRRQINRGDDRPTNQQNVTKEVVNAAQNLDAQTGRGYEDRDSLPLSLSLGTASYSSQIFPAMPSNRLPLEAPSSFYPPPLPIPMPRWPMDLTTNIPYLSSLSNSFDNTGSRRFPLIPIHQPPVNFFHQSSAFSPPSSAPKRPVTTTTRSVTATTRLVTATTRPVNSTVRGYRSQSAGNKETSTISPPFPWATEIRGGIHSLEYLESKQITEIYGNVQCRHCEKVYEVTYNLRERFAEVEKIFGLKKRIMRERAPSIWTNPEPRRCEHCGREKAVKPVIAERKSQINWLFLLLGQTLGYCTLEQLKNFCKHSKSHRTGAKDRVLYLTYLGLCKMLQPKSELFSRETGTRR